MIGLNKQQMQMSNNYDHFFIKYFVLFFTDFFIFLKDLLHKVYLMYKIRKN